MTVSGVGVRAVEGHVAGKGDRRPVGFFSAASRARNAAMSETGAGSWR
jgi:hypothetical protein